MSGKEEKPWDRLRAMLDELQRNEDAIANASACIGQAAASVGNMEVVYKDSYARRPVDAVASKAIRDVMESAVESATQTARKAHAAKQIAAANRAEQLRSVICQEAGKLAVALGVYARDLSSSARSK